MRHDHNYITVIFRFKTVTKFYQLNGDTFYVLCSGISEYLVAI